MTRTTKTSRRKTRERDTASRIFGYARASSKDPECRRQDEALTAAGVETAFLYRDRAIGRRRHRPGWDACRPQLRSGDTLVVHTLDRIGLDLTDILETLLHLQADGIRLQVLSPAEQEAVLAAPAVTEFIRSLVGADQTLRLERARQGLIASRETGIRGGRRYQVSDDKVRAAMGRIAAGERAAQIAVEFGISRQALDKRILRLREIDRAAQTGLAGLDGGDAPLVPRHTAGLRLSKRVAGRIVTCERVRFPTGAAAIDTLLRRAAAVGTVGPRGRTGDYWAELLDSEDGLLGTIALDRNAWNGLKNRWIGCRIEEDGTDDAD